MQSIDGRLFWFWRLLAVTLAGLQAWDYRFQTFLGDCVSYFDMARTAYHGNPDVLINGTWCPLYPALIGLVFFLFNPPTLWVYLWVHALNVVLFLVTLGAFEFFFRQLVRQRLPVTDCPSGYTHIAGSTLLCASYLAFISMSLCFLGVNLDVPDMIVNACTFAAAGLLIKASVHQHWRDYAALGAVCAIGFLGKTVFGPLSVLVAFCITVQSCPIERKLRHLSAFVIVFLLLAAPFVIALSDKLGHFSLGEIGKITYAETIGQQYNSLHPQGAELKHPPAKIYSRPPVYYFDLPGGGTYSLCTYRTYWLDGAVIRFRPLNHLLVSTINILIYLLKFGLVLLAAILITQRITGRSAIPLRTLIRNYDLYLITLAGSFIFINGSLFMAPWAARYYCAFAIILTTLVLASLSYPQGQRGKRLRAFAVALICGFFAWSLTGTVVFDLQNGINSHADDAFIAAGLHDLGIKPQDKVAMLWYDDFLLKDKPYQVRNNGWAYLSDVRIVANIEEPQTFWSLSAPEQDKILDKLRSLGIRAVVVSPGYRPPSNQLGTFHRLGRSATFARLL